jgi:hypothetical protein
MADAEYLVSVLDSARTEFGPEALKRIEGPIRAAAGLEPPAPTGDPLRYPEGIYIPGLKSAAWHSRDWMPDVAILPVPGGVLPMLEGLDRVDWASLEHAYGPADDVPGQLRALLSSDRRVRENALHELFGNIWHQGTVYPASAAAVPFLYELLTAPGVPDRTGIALLLASIAGGAGYMEVHGDGDDDERAREAAEVAAVRRAVSAGLRHLLPYLTDGEPEMRMSIAEALGNYPEHAEWSLPAVEAALETETEDEVLEALGQSRDRLGGA